MVLPEIKCDICNIGRKLPEIAVCENTKHQFLTPVNGQRDRGGVSKHLQSSSLL